MTQVQLIPATGAVQLRREYLMTDALGSTHRVVSEQAAIIPDGKQAFATFGERANADDRSTLTDAAQANFNPVLPRGYTGHQQADEVGIIHMNGRIYDPRLGRFLQADPLMEDIFDPQAINAYSYVRNNPMNATDPTGHWRSKEQGILRQVAALAITIGTGINIAGALKAASASMCLAPGAAIYTTAATQAALAGAASGALTSGTLKGALLGALGSFTFNQIGLSSMSTSERIFAHGIAGGTLEMLGSGKFGHGFVSAGLNKALSPLADTDHLIRVGVVNAAIGGTISEITGGDFANGAQMAAIQYAFNALLSDEDVNGWRNTFARWFGYERPISPRMAAAAGAAAVNNGIESTGEAIVEQGPMIATTLLAPEFRLAGGAFRWGLSLGQMKYMLRTAQTAYKGTTIVGHAIGKHAQRRPDIWGKLSGGPPNLAPTGMRHMRDILRGPGTFNPQKDPETGIMFLEKRLLDGRGIRLQMDYKFKGFIE